MANWWRRLRDRFDELDPLEKTAAVTVGILGGLGLGTLAWEPRPRASTPTPGTAPQSVPFPDVEPGGGVGGGPAGARPPLARSRPVGAAHGQLREGDIVRLTAPFRLRTGASVHAGGPMLQPQLVRVVAPRIATVVRGPSETFYEIQLLATPRDHGWAFVPSTAVYVDAPRGRA
jgi:hypothetical protein